MQITNVDLNLAKREEGNNVRAYATLTIDNCFVVRSVKVIEKDNPEKPLSVAMPSRRNPKTQKWDDIAHPINQETRTMIEDAVLAKYREALENEAASGAESAE